MYPSLICGKEPHFRPGLVGNLYLLLITSNGKLIIKFCLPIFAFKKYSVLGTQKLYEPCREKTDFLHMRKQRRRSASR